jgi:hypothetical protein
MVCRLAMGGLFGQKFVQSTELSATTKLSSGDGTPPIANVHLWAGFTIKVKTLLLLLP